MTSTEQEEMPRLKGVTKRVAALARGHKAWGQGHRGLQINTAPCAQHSVRVGRRQLKPSGRQPTATGGDLGTGQAGKAPSCWWCHEGP